MAKILIVDDSSVSRKKLRKILESNNHDIIDEARDGIEGLNKYKELKPDLVTMDITMPNLDGISCLKQIRENDSGVKVIMITALGNGEKIFEALSNGATNYITKPFEEEKIIEVINEALSE